MHMALPEFAAMVKLQMLYPTSNLTLFTNESWKVLLLMHELFQHEVASVAASRQQSLHTSLHLVRPPLYPAPIPHLSASFAPAADPEALDAGRRGGPQERMSFCWVFESHIDEEEEEEDEEGGNDGGIRRMGCNYVVRGFRKLVARVRSPTVCLPRQVAMAGYMGRCGHWGPASELLLQIVRSLQHAQVHDTPLVSREERRFELATMQSMVAECLVDKVRCTLPHGGDWNAATRLFSTCSPPDLAHARRAA